MMKDLSEQNHGCVDFFLSSVTSMIFAKSEKNERANERQLLSFFSRRHTGNERKEEFHETRVVERAVAFFVRSSVSKTF